MRIVFDLYAAAFAVLGGFALALLSDDGGFLPLFVRICAIFFGFYAAFRLLKPHLHWSKK